MNVLKILDMRQEDPLGDGLAALADWMIKPRLLAASGVAGIEVYNSHF